MGVPTAVLEVKLLGGGSVCVRGEAVKLSRRAASLALLAFVIARRGQPVARDFLAFSLFPDLEETQAYNELRRHLYLLTKALPPELTGSPWLFVDTESIRWTGAPGATVDVIEFERLAGAQETYEAAVAAYGGDLLEEVYDDWLVVERERLRALYLDRLSALVERCRAARDHGRALAYANRLLASDPLREDVVRRVMAIRYAAGDSPGALAEFDRFARFLRAEIGVAPMSETIAVREAILREAPLIGSVDRVAGDLTRTPVRQPHALPFVGREAELALLRARWERAARGFGNGIFVGGEAGVGKTRLVGELARSVEAEGGRVYSGGTSSPESAPYQCIVEALRAALAVLAADSGNALTLAVLARAFPELAGAGVESVRLRSLPPEREATRLFTAFADAIQALAAARPLLVVFEDVHWASPATIDALATICRRIDRARVLVVVTYRDEESPAAHPLRRLVNALGVEERMTGLHVHRFDRSDVARTIARAAQCEPPPDLVTRLYAQTEGNALFLTEAIANEFEGEGRLENAADAAFGGIESVLAARISRLDDAALVVAEIAAACGDGCSVDVVRDVAGFSSAETLDAFNVLLDRRLMREAGPRSHCDYAFTHNLIASAIYRRMEPRARMRRHARLAHIIEGQGELALRDVRELARHCAAAGLDAPAARWYLRAARDAAGLYANDDAVAFATRAIERAGADDDLTMEALFLREEASARLGDRDVRERDLERLRELAASPESRCRVALRVLAFRRTGDDRGDEAAAVALLATAAAELGDVTWRASADVADAKYRFATGRYAEAKSLALGVLPRLGGSPREYVDALGVAIDAHMALGEFADANRAIAELIAIAERSDDRFALCEILLRRISVDMLQQRFAEVMASGRELAERYRAMGDRMGEARALSNVAAAAVRLSRWEEARSANVAAAAIGEAIGDRWGVARTLMNLGMLLGRCGDLDAARAALIAARAHHERLGDRRAETAARINEGFIALWQGHAADAKRLSLEALEAARAMQHGPYVASALGNLGAAERDLGELDSAITNMEAGLEIQFDLGRMADGVSDLADVALAYAMKGDLERACAVAERMLAVEPSWTDAAIYPPYPVWTMACILHWYGDARADEVLAWAARLANALAESIDSADLRARFEALPFFAAIRTAVEAHVWPQWPNAGRQEDELRVHSRHGTGAA